MKKIIHTNNAPGAVGPYSQATSIGDLVFTSGQLGIDIATGKLAQDVVSQAHCSMKNVGAILQQEGLSYSNIIKSTIFVTNMQDFAKINEVYSSYFSGDYPARSCVEVAALPLGGQVEIECIASK